MRSGCACGGSTLGIRADRRIVSGRLIFAFNPREDSRATVGLGRRAVSESTIDGNRTRAAGTDRNTLIATRKSVPGDRRGRSWPS